jgi:hypothetical protein
MARARTVRKTLVSRQSEKIKPAAKIGPIVPAIYERVRQPEPDREPEPHNRSHALGKGEGVPSIGGIRERGMGYRQL